MGDPFNGVAPPVLLLSAPGGTGPSKACDSAYETSNAAKSAGIVWLDEFVWLKNHLHPKKFQAGHIHHP
jgi:hypothetical protein